MQSAVQIFSLLLLCTAQRATSLFATSQTEGNGEFQEHIVDLELVSSSDQSSWPWSRPSAGPSAQARASEPADQLNIHAGFFETEAAWNEEKGRLEAQLEAKQGELKKILAAEQTEEKAAKQTSRSEAKMVAKAQAAKQAAIDARAKAKAAKHAIDAATLQQEDAQVTEQARAAKADKDRVEEIKVELAIKQLELKETTAKVQKLQADVDAKQLELQAATQAEQEAEQLYQDSRAQKVAKDRATDKTEAESAEAELDVQVQQQLKVLKMQETKRKLQAEVKSKGRELKEFTNAGWKHRG